MSFLGNKRCLFLCFGFFALSLNGLKINILDKSKYHDLDGIVSFLKRIAEFSPKQFKLEFKSIGNTYIPGKKVQNEIYLVTIGEESAPILFFDCGIHAREWISPATCLQLIQNLAIIFHYNEVVMASEKLRKYKTLFNYQWQIAPMMNPDGYQYSHQKKNGEYEYRFARKNLRPLSAMNLTEEQRATCKRTEQCLGVDLNRNFPSGWGKGEENFERDSRDPSLPIYKGPKPLSEPETMALHKHIEKIRPRLLTAMSIHSFGKDIFYPKGFLKDDDEDQVKGKERKFLVNFARKFNKALKYRIGNVDQLLPETLSGGATDDYYWTHWKINLTYTIELDPDINNWKDGFHLPEKKIRKVGAKMWKAIRLMAMELDRIYPHYAKYT